MITMPNAAFPASGHILRRSGPPVLPGERGAALQFSLREPRIASTIVGMSQALSASTRPSSWPPSHSRRVVWEELAGLAAAGGDMAALSVDLEPREH